jgi:catechol 2,3-dioxygenase-like lactoylglutathione lyase family enzyme
MLKNAAIVPYIPVADVGRARKFYEEKLGLEPKEEYAGGVIYECGKGSWVFMANSIATGGGAKTAEIPRIAATEWGLSELRRVAAPVAAGETATPAQRPRRLQPRTAPETDL